MLKPKQQIWKQKPTLFCLIFDKIINPLLFQLSFYPQLLVHGFRLYHVSLYRKVLFSSWNIEHKLYWKQYFKHKHVYVCIFIICQLFRFHFQKLEHIKTKERSCQPDFGIIKENLNALLLEQWTGPPDMFTCNDYVMRASHATELFVT